MNFSESLKKLQKKPQKVQLIGYAANPKFHAMQEGLVQLNKDRYVMEVRSMHESEYDKKVQTLKRKDPHFYSMFKLQKIPKRGEKQSLKSASTWISRPPILLIDDKPTFDVEELLQDDKVSKTHRNIELHTRHRQRAMKTLDQMFIEDGQKSFAFITFKSQNQVIHTIIELYKLHLPKTCQNFIELLQGVTIDGFHYTYKNTPITRIKKNGYIQGGNIDGKGGRSIYGKYFEDESFMIKHDEPGIIGMANSDRPHSNGSQFYITLAPLNGFDGNKVAFGKVIVGLKALQAFSKPQSNDQQSPYTSLIIIDCGLHKQAQLFSPVRSTLDSYEILEGGDKEVEFDTREPEEISPLRKNNLKQNFMEKLYIVRKIRVFGPDSVTLTTFLIQEQQKFKEATGDFTAVVDALQHAFRSISNLLQMGGIGQKTKDLKKAAKQMVLDELYLFKKVVLLYCLDDEEIIQIPTENRGKYIVVFRALDIPDDQPYYDNTDIQASMFLVLKKQTTIFKPVLVQDLKQSGDNVIGSGYCLYGQSTQLVLGIGFHTNIFTYDSLLGEFILSHPKVIIQQNQGF